MHAVRRAARRAASTSAGGNNSSSSKKAKKAAWSANEKIGAAIDAMRRQAAQAAESNATLKEAASTASTVKSKVASCWSSVMERVAPARDAVASATKPAREAMRFDQWSQTLRELTGDLFGSEAKTRPYSRRAKMEAMEKQREQSGDVEAPAAGPVSDSREVVLVRTRQGEWADKWDTFKRRVEGTDLYRSVANSTLAKSVGDAHAQFQDRVEDLRDMYDTTQNPVISTLRDGADELLGETDSGAALAAIRRLDPDFSLIAFMEEMEHYMVPRVVKAYLKGDLDTLQLACAGDAMAFMNASMRQRMAQGVYFDERILDVSHITFHDAKLVEGNDAVLVVTFMCQHVHCIRSADGTIVEGSEHDIRSTYYSWAVVRDMDNDEFNWRILDISITGIRALI
ncbi:Tim44-like domain-containing protein [Plasmodiophora brassicae]|uniref:Tim44-like domain-containing protein n=1 Tax=Plasmodiophora brassicae TaxID=37360 RepID=A0A0G4IT86_PLABS|nr:hypothetical protein PBRA_006556 [Plasmodiophora brassicae]SPQ94526.1 unnamed protein product [Plasmodiophora brassicae]